jgi:hypothetical protein
MEGVGAFASVAPGINLDGNGVFIIPAPLPELEIADLIAEIGAERIPQHRVK